MRTSQPKRKQRNFGAGAKVMISTAAVAALFGGWNAIGHLDAAKAEAEGATAAGVAASNVSALIQLPAPTPATPLAGARASTVMDALGIKPIPTLPPTSALLANGAVDFTQNTTSLAQLPNIPALQPLQPLTQLPAMPSRQQASAASSNNSFGSGGQVSGGS